MNTHQPPLASEAGHPHAVDVYVGTRIEAPIVYFFPPDLNAVDRLPEPNPLAASMGSIVRRMSSLLAEAERLLEATTKH